MKSRISLAIATGCSLIAISHAHAAAPDLILFNGRVFTSDLTNLHAEAIAIRSERIIAVDTTEKIKVLADSHTRQIDLQDHVVVPGFNDAHYHHMPTPPGTRLRLKFPEPTWEDVLAELPEAVKTAPKGSWIFGEIGSVIVNDPAATREALDRIAPDHPVFLHSWFGRGHIINARAMQLLNVAEEESDPMAGHWERFPGTQRVTGKFFEYAGWPLFRRFEEGVSEADLIASIHQLSSEAARFGITSIQNMTYISPHRYVELLGRAKFPLRMRVIRWPATNPHGRDVTDGLDVPLHPPGAPLVTVSGTKWILDGSPLERGMALRTMYRDRPGWSGLLNFPEPEVRAMLRETVARHDQLLLHAPGDRTVEVVLNAMEAVDPKLDDWPARRVRIEHGDGMFADLMPRARKLGIIVVQNPTHFDPSMTPATQRFGPDNRYFPLRSLLEAGIPVALGSDGPLNPGLNLMFAILHPVHPSEAITREQAVIAYTQGSAFAEFAETDKGTITSGKLADLAVLSQDIFTVQPAELPATQSVLTIVGGTVVYDSGALGQK